MAYAGILKGNFNTGDDSELLTKFVAPLSVTTDYNASVTDTISLKRKASRSAAQRWRITATLEPTENAGELLAYLVDKGVDQAMYVRMPQPVNVEQPDNYIAITVNGDYPAGTVNMLYDIEDDNSSIAAGSFIQFSGDAKVYLVKRADYHYLEITPPLLRAIPTGAIINTGKRVTMIALLEGDSMLGIKYDDGYLASPGSYTFVELL